MIGPLVEYHEMIQSHIRQYEGIVPSPYLGILEPLKRWAEYYLYYFSMHGAFLPSEARGRL